MGTKTKVIASLVLGAASVVAIATSPALADNNSNYLNSLALQMYAQNQQRAAYSPYAYNNYGNYNGNALGNGAYLYGAQTRGYGTGGYGNTGYGNGYGHAYGGYGRGNHHGGWWR